MNLNSVSIHYCLLSAFCVQLCSSDKSERTCGLSLSVYVYWCVCKFIYVYMYKKDLSCVTRHNKWHMSCFLLFSVWFLFLLAPSSNWGHQCSIYGIIPVSFLLRLHVHTLWWMNGQKEKEKARKKAQRSSINTID